jgi:hypothetical protein
MCYWQSLLPAVTGTTATLLGRRQRLCVHNLAEHIHLLWYRLEAVNFVMCWDSSYKEKLNYLRFQVLTTASMKFRTVFWDVLPSKIIVDTHPWWWRQHVPLKRRWTAYIDPVPAVFWRPGCGPQCMSRLQCQNWTLPETDMSVWSRGGGGSFYRK